MISRVVIVHSVVCFLHELFILFSRFFLVISLSCFNKIQNVSDIFLLTGYMHNALYVSSMKYDFLSLEVFCNFVIFCFQGVYNLLHFYQSSSHFFYLIPYFRFVSWHGVDDVL